MTDVDDDQDLVQLHGMLDEARRFVAADDRPGLDRTLWAIWRRLRLPFFFLFYDVDDVRVELDTLCDNAFPIPPETGDRLSRAADLLDTPWQTTRRTAALADLMGTAPTEPDRLGLEPLAELALAAPDSPVRTRLLRLVLNPRTGYVDRETAARVLIALHDIGAMDAEAVDWAFLGDAHGRNTADIHLGDVIFRGSLGSDGFRSALRDAFDDFIWRITASVNPDDWNVTPTAPPPRGPRFVHRGLDIAAGRVPTAPPSHDEAYVKKLVGYLCSAELTDTERAELDEQPSAEILAAAPPGPIVSYNGEDLIGAPAVAAAIARLPEVLPSYADGDPEEYEMPREDLCCFLGLSTRDEVTWDLGFTDEVKSIVDSGPDLIEDDLIEQHLLAQPDVVRADHADREWFVVELARPLPAEEMLARYVDALHAAHRELGRRRFSPR